MGGSAQDVRRHEDAQLPRVIDSVGELLDSVVDDLEEVVITRHGRAGRDGCSERVRGTQGDVYLLRSPTSAHRLGHPKSTRLPRCPARSPVSAGWAAFPLRNRSRRMLSLLTEVGRERFATADSRLPRRWERAAHLFHKHRRPISLPN